MYWALGLGPWVLQWGLPILVVSCLIVFTLGELAFLVYWGIVVPLAFLLYWGIVKPFLLAFSVCKKCTRWLINSYPAVPALEQGVSPSPFDTDKQPALRPDQPSREGRTKILTWIPVGNIEKSQLKQVPDEAIVKALVKHPDFLVVLQKFLSSAKMSV